MTLTFELLTLKLVRLIAHGVLNLALVGDSLLVFVFRLTKFEVRRPLKILRIYCVSINRPGDLDLSPYDL